jgi:hypothetical protein
LGTTVACSADVLVAFPVVTVYQVNVKATSVASGCDVGGDLAMLFDVPAMLAQAMSDGIRDALRKDLAGPSVPNDPTLKPIFDQVLATGGICRRNEQDWLCVRATWPSGVLAAGLAILAASAPTPTQPAAAFQFDDLLANLRTIAPRRCSQKISGYNYPAKRTRTDAAFNCSKDTDDGDGTIFNGLLCSVGEAEGCLAVERSQSRTTGQVFRSPDYVGEWNGTNQFSGDQFTGIVNYAQTTGDKRALADLLRFLAEQRYFLPDPGALFDTGYRSCFRDQEFTCLLLGDEWFWLNYLAAKFGVGNQIPIEERDPAKKYGQTWDTLPYRAALTEPGFELHLVGAQIWMLQRARLTSPAIRQAAAILAARQNQNPFFLLLHLGNDQRVADQISTKCNAQPQELENQWAWERSQDDAAWRKSMRWDCIFIIKALQQARMDQK